jgi:aspartokinase-like uncharacterized kinase
LARRSDLVLVPGGGPFADEVRAAQQRWGFDDAAAHHMALLGMEQYGRMLCSLKPGLRPAANSDEIVRALNEGVTPVWIPSSMVLDEPSITPGWDVTSDSLAAWLCGRLGADGLLLIKSVPPGGLRAGVRELVERGVVDAAFPHYAHRVSGAIRLLSCEEADRLDAALRGVVETTGASAGSGDFG